MIDPEGEMRRLMELKQQMKEVESLREAKKSAEEARRLSQSIEDMKAAARYKEDVRRSAEARAGMTDLVRSRIDTIPSLYDHMEEIARAQAEAAEASTARRAVTQIVDEIRKFESTLEEDSEIGIRLVSFGQDVVVHIDEIDYYQPNLIVFGGHLENRSGVRLIQHVSQLSFLLVRVPRLEPEKPRRPIGFTVSEDVVDEGD